MGGKEWDGWIVQRPRSRRSERLEGVTSRSGARAKAFLLMRFKSLTEDSLESQVLEMGARSGDCRRVVSLSGCGWRREGGRRSEGRKQLSRRMRRWNGWFAWEGRGWKREEGDERANRDDKKA